VEGYNPYDPGAASRLAGMYEAGTQARAREIANKYKIDRATLEQQYKIALMQSGNQREAIEATREYQRGQLEQARQEMLQVSIPKVQIDQFLAQANTEIARGELQAKQYAAQGDVAYKQGLLQQQRDEMLQLGIPKLMVDRFVAESNAAIQRGELGLKRDEMLQMGIPDMLTRRYSAEAQAAYQQGQLGLTAQQQQQQAIEQQRRYALDIAKYGTELASQPDRYFQAQQFAAMAPRLLGLQQGAGPTGGPTPGINQLGSLLAQATEGLQNQATPYQLPQFPTMQPYQPPPLSEQPGFPSMPAYQPPPLGPMPRFPTAQFGPMAPLTTPWGATVPGYPGSAVAQPQGGAAPGTPGAAVEPGGAAYPRPTGPTGPTDIGGVREQGWYGGGQPEMMLHASGDQMLGFEPWQTAQGDPAAARQAAMRGLQGTPEVGAPGPTPAAWAPDVDPFRYAGAGAGGGNQADLAQQWGQQYGYAGAPAAAGDHMVGINPVGPDPYAAYGGAAAYKAAGGGFDPGGYRTGGGYIQQPTFSPGGGTPRGGQPRYPTGPATYGGPAAGATPSYAPQRPMYEPGGAGGGGPQNLSALAADEQSRYHQLTQRRAQLQAAGQMAGWSPEDEAELGRYQARLRAPSNYGAADPREKQISQIAKASPPSPYDGLNESDQATLRLMESIYKRGGQGVAGGELERMGTAQRGFMSSAGKLLGYDPEDFTRSYQQYRPAQASASLAG
jgi:hypothetical protein